MSKPDLYDDLKSAGQDLDNHESDLYVRDTPEARAIFKQHDQPLRQFLSQVDKRVWLEAKFQYSPFWRQRA